MVTATKRRALTVDDDDSFDQRVFDRAHWPKRVFRDGYGPRVGLMLTDAAPSPSSRGTVSTYDAAAHMRATQRRFDGYRLSDSEAQRHRPHCLPLSDYGAAYSRLASESARAEAMADASRAWRTAGQAGKTSPAGSFAVGGASPGRAFGPDDPDGDNGGDRDGGDNSLGSDDPVERARQEYIDRITTDWQRNRFPPTSPAEVNPVGLAAHNQGVNRSPPAAAFPSRSSRSWSAIEAERRKVTAESPTDAQSIKDQAYAEYCKAISEAWRK